MPLSWRQLASLLGPPGHQGPSGLTLTSPAAGDKLPLLYAWSSLTISEVRALVRGTSPAVTFSLRHGSDFSAAGTLVKADGMVSSDSLKLRSSASRARSASPYFAHALSLDIAPPI